MFGDERVRPARDFEIVNSAEIPKAVRKGVFFFVILAVGTVDEITQPLVNRMASLADWLADAIGIVTVLLVYVCFKKAISGLAARTDVEFLNLVTWR